MVSSFLWSGIHGVVVPSSPIKTIATWLQMSVSEQPQTTARILPLQPSITTILRIRCQISKSKKTTLQVGVSLKATTPIVLTPIITITQLNLSSLNFVQLCNSFPRISTPYN